MRIYKNFSAFNRLSTIKNITLVQYRNYSTSNFAFRAPVTCITGPNGSGKTNLLDAVYYLCYTKSYFTAYQQNTAQHGTDGFRVEGVFDRRGTAETVTCKWKQGKKEVMADGVSYERITDHIGNYAAVMIAPDDMELVNEGSEPRRKWVDGILSQTNPEYFERLIRYQKVLLQRNAWLKQNAGNPAPDYTALEYYDGELINTGDYIHQTRREFTDVFSPLLSAYYARLSQGREEVGIRYDSDLLRKPFSVWLKDGLQHDMRFQRTLRGIHKDDWEFALNGSSIKTFGSQGQKKSYLFAMKLAQYDYLRNRLGHSPILLLDDIFEKLDQSRMEALLHVIRGEGFGQVILTDTHPERVREAFGNDLEIGFINL